MLAHCSVRLIAFCSMQSLWHLNSGSDQESGPGYCFGETYYMLSVRPAEEHGTTQILKRVDEEVEVEPR